jgi:hypothetical protein
MRWNSVSLSCKVVAGTQFCWEWLECTIGWSVLARRWSVLDGPGHTFSIVYRTLEPGTLFERSVRELTPAHSTSTIRKTTNNARL